MIPDIKLLDINMPCKDGVTCIREIRWNESLHDVPAIMYTSLKSMEYLDQGYGSGANFFLIKANSLHLLAEKLEKIISVDRKTYMYYPPKINLYWVPDFSYIQHRHPRFLSYYLSCTII